MDKKYIKTKDLEGVSGKDYRTAVKLLQAFDIEPINGPNKTKLYAIDELLSLLFLIMPDKLAYDKMLTSVSNTSTLDDIVKASNYGIDQQTLQAIDWKQAGEFAKVKEKILTLDEKIGKMVTATTARKALTEVVNNFKVGISEYLEKVAKKHPDLLAECDEMAGAMYDKLQIVLGEYSLQENTEDDE